MASIRSPSAAESAPESSAVPKHSPGSRSSPPPANTAKRCPQCGGRYPADFRVCPRDAEPLEDAPADEDPLVGSTLGDSYEIVRVLGEGGMGRVYEARHRRLHTKRYAVKMLHHELARQPDVVARFQREAEASSALLHPNVMGVFDVNTTSDGRPYIVCELLEGQELGDYLEQVGKLDVPTAVHLVRQVCDALAAAHERGIVHRDVKPENVFLTGSPAAPVVKVLDFGISKLAQEGQNLTRTGTVMGTPAYMAPEQARGDKVDARADVYAAGAILYRALTGRGPFEGRDPMATLTAVLAEEPPRPRAVATEIPQAVELVIQRAMAKEPRERYPTMGELCDALAPFDSGEIKLDRDFVPENSRAARTIVGRARQAEAVARTLLAGQTQALATDNRAANLARPTIVMLTFVGLALVMGLVIDMVAAAIRLVSGRDLAPVEVVLTVIGAFLVLLTPSVLWLRFLSKKVWVSTPRSIEIARRARRTLLAAAAGYGVTALISRIVASVVRREAEGIVSPVWSLVTFVAALGIGALVWFFAGALERANKL